MLFSYKWMTLRLIGLLLTTLVCSSASTSFSEFGFHFTSWPSWRVLAPGAELQLECSTNLPPDNIRWLLNHQFVDPFSNSSSTGGTFPPSRLESNRDRFGKIEPIGQNGSKLILKIAVHESNYKLQEGIYQCVASVGAVVITSLPGRVEVASLEAFPIVSWNRTVKLTAGSSFRISCPKPESIPEPSMLYYRKEKIIDLSLEKEFFATQSGDLFVLKVGSSTRGWYSCAAHNSVLNKTVEFGGYTRIIVKKTNPNRRDETPRLISSDSTITTLVGRTVGILCLALNPPLDSLYWTFQNAKPSQHLISESAVSVIVANVSTNDEGLYRCHSKNHIGASFVDSTLIVQEPPYIIEFPKSQSIPEMTNLTLTCLFGGNPTPIGAWVFNGQLLTSTESILVVGNSLQFQLITRDQSGIYQCFGFSAFGAAQATAILTVIPTTVTASPRISGKDLIPSLDSESASEEEVKDSTGLNRFPTSDHWQEVDLKAPTRPRITKLSDESVMVTWNIESEEGLTILFFKVQYKILKEPIQEPIYHDWKTLDEDIPPHVRSFEVTGLKPEHVYRFRVAAVYANNDNQLGPSSKKFLLEKDIKLKRPEGSPSILSFRPEGASSAVVSWQYESKTQTEGFIISYRESSSAADYTKITLLGDFRRNYTVNFLLPNIPYDFKICSFNMAGTSNYSERKTYYPKGFTFVDDNEEEVEEPNMKITIVKSDPDGLTNSFLYIALGTGLAVLFLIVLSSFLIYSCRNKHTAGEAVVESKFMDTSLRIHRSCSTEHASKYSQNICQCQSQTENQVPLLALGRSTKLLKEGEPYHFSDNNSQNVGGVYLENYNSTTDTLKEARTEEYHYSPT